MGFPARITVVEVGPRDGFQMEARFIPTELKVELIDAVAAAGVRKIEATSFVSPRVVPQMADAAEVMAAVQRRPGVRYTALVPNLKGARLAMEAEVDSMRLVVCATETYNRRNARLTIDESFQVCQEMLQEASGSATAVEAVIGVAFGCPFEGRVPEERVFEMAHRFADLGIRELSVADSVGLANPAAIRRVMARLRSELPGVELSLHLHDTRGLGLANALAALEVGIDTFDASIGGLGGCPVMTGGTGNIATEDFVNMCGEMGLETGVAVAGIQGAARRIAEFLGRTLPSHVLSAGTPQQLYDSLPEAAS